MSSRRSLRLAGWPGMASSGSDAAWCRASCASPSHTVSCSQSTHSPHTTRWPRSRTRLMAPLFSSTLPAELALLSSSSRLVRREAAAAAAAAGAAAAHHQVVLQPCVEAPGKAVEVLYAVALARRSRDQASEPRMPPQST